MNARKYHLQTILFVVVILIALFLRTYNLSYMEFKGDEAFNSLKALKFAEGGHIPLTSSVGTTGINEPPMFMYLLAIPYFFTVNPIIAAGFIALLNVLGIVFCYLLVKRFYSERAALIAASFYAVSPWQILFSRKIWAQDLLAFFAILFVYFVFLAVYEKKKSYIAYAFIVLSILLQLHFSAAYFFIIAAAIIIRHWKIIDKAYFAIGAILFLLMLLPYLAFQVKNDFVDAHTALAAVKKNNIFHAEAFTIPFNLVTTNGFDSLLGRDFSDFRGTAFKMPFLDFISMALLFLSIIPLYLARKGKGLILVVWLIAGTAYLAFSKIGLIGSHYFPSFFPLYFIMIGITLDWLAKRSNKLLRYAIYAIIIILLLYQSAFSIKLLAFIKEKQCINGEYGPPYTYRLNNIKDAINKFGIMAKLDEVHNASCNCEKCDILATEFIVKNLGVYGIRDSG